MEEEIILKAKNNTEPNKMAGAIAQIIKEGKKLSIQAVGAGAVNQAIKSIAIARRYTVDKGIDLYIIPVFADIVIEGRTVTAIRLIIKEEI